MKFQLLKESKSIWKQEFLKRKRYFDETRMMTKEENFDGIIKTYIEKVSDASSCPQFPLFTIISLAITRRTKRKTFFAHFPLYISFSSIVKDYILKQWLKKWFSRGSNECRRWNAFIESTALSAVNIWDVRTNVIRLNISVNMFICKFLICAIQIHAFHVFIMNGSVSTLEIHTSAEWMWKALLMEYFIH